jgi:hypothetical protein
LSTACASEIEVICSILGLLFSMIAMHADDLPVISDSEAFSHLGQNVQVPGLVFAVPSNRLGTTFIVQESLAGGGPKNHSVINGRPHPDLDRQSFPGRPWLDARAI